MSMRLECSHCGRDTTRIDMLFFPAEYAGCGCRFQLCRACSANSRRIEEAVGTHCFRHRQDDTP